MESRRHFSPTHLTPSSRVEKTRVIFFPFFGVAAEGRIESWSRDRGGYKSGRFFESSTDSDEEVDLRVCPDPDTSPPSWSPGAAPSIREGGPHPSRPDRTPTPHLSLSVRPVVESRGDP